MLKVLVVEDKESMASMLKETLESEGFAAPVAETGDKGIEMLRDEAPDLVLTDLKLPGKDGLEILKSSKEMNPLRPVIMMTAHGSVEAAVDAMKEGAFDFITKPFNIDHLLLKIRIALENKRLQTENMLLKEELSTSIGLPDIIGNSTSITKAADAIKKAAPQKTTILLLGESGTGKELFARAIHSLSGRGDFPFVAINCAAIPRDLLESELFGHEKGAFTGAESRKLGKFELANRGTVFLDEIAEMDMSLQAKLLRVIQEGEIDRVGGTKPIRIDVRVVAASNADIEKAVVDGKFREDLFYRINVFPVIVPPLRQRVDDIPLLAEFFLIKHAASMRSRAVRFSQEAIDALIAAPWKGNVRELENAVERAIILCDGDSILPEHISLPMISGAVSSPSDSTEDLSLEETAKTAARAAETASIKQALIKTSGNKTKAAALLGVSYKTLLTKIKDYEIG
jgi:DNA-binding NtrC family response regulator